jgi:hypothetical protein
MEDGNYAIYGISEKGTKQKMGSFSIKDNVISNSTSDIIPDGDINTRVSMTLQRYMNDHHGYVHIEKVS